MAETIGEKIRLPEPKHESGTSIEKAIHGRRSVREYDDAPLSLQDVSQVLWAAQGVVGKRIRRAAPSAGATYPLETYLVVERVIGLEEGIYRYVPSDHSLEKLSAGKYSEQLSDAALGQDCVRDAAANIVFSAVYGRTTSRYGERGVRYVHMDAGHAAENVYLQCQSLGLGTVAVGAFDDAKVKEVLGLKDDEEPLYVMPLGKV